MSEYKNPYVKIERLSYSVIERFLTSHSSVKEQPEEKNEKPLKFAKTEKNKEKRLKFAIPKEKYIKGSKFTKPDEETGRLTRSRSAKQKIKTYNLKDVSDDESSVSETDYSDGKTESNHSKDPDDEVRPYSKSQKTNGKRQKIAKVKELTDYEKLILKNKSDRMAFLKSLKINEVKESFSEAVNDFSLAVKLKRPYNKKPKSLPCLRLKIARSSKVNFDLSEKALEDRARSEAKEALMKMEKIKRVLPESVYLEDVLHSDQSYKSFMSDFTDLDQGCTKPIKNYESRFNDMELLTSHVKTFPTVLTAVDIHPMQEKTIIAAGAKNGNIYLWNMTDSVQYAFELHNQGISRLKFCPENPHLIMCCSRDGLLRRGDLVSNVYYKVTDYKDCTYFDFVGPDTYLVAHRDGYVSVVDMRASQKDKQYDIKPHLCHDLSLKSVSVHPLNKYEFITPTNKGCVRLWDLRKLQKHPVVEACHSSKNTTLSSAIYSPLTGKSVLTSSKNGQICRSDTARWGQQPLLMFKMKLPIGFPICATWQPRTDSVFAVGSKLNPRTIDIYNRCSKLYNYSHACIKGAIYFCSFHPSLPIVAAIGSMKVYPFADKNLQIVQ